MDKIFDIFDGSSPLLVVVDGNKEEVEKVTKTVISHVDPNAEISSDLAGVSHELLHRSEGKSNDAHSIIACDVVEEDNPEKYDFIHMDNIATQGEKYNIGAVVGLVSTRNIDDILIHSGSMEKFALSKAVMMESDSVVTYLSE